MMGKSNHGSWCCTTDNVFSHSIVFRAVVGFCQLFFPAHQKVQVITDAAARKAGALAQTLRPPGSGCKTPPAATRLASEVTTVTMPLLFQRLSSRLFKLHTVNMTVCRYLFSQLGVAAAREGLIFARLESRVQRYRSATPPPPSPTHTHTHTLSHLPGNLYHHL